jgi:hypothetical protein
MRGGVQELAKAAGLKGPLAFDASAEIEKPALKWPRHALGGAACCQYRSIERSVGRRSRRSSDAASL